MNLQFISAIATILGKFLSSVLLPFQLNSIYADESETNTEQGLNQENIGSEDLTNVNCGASLKKSYLF
jgi:regulatory protein YycI of two-component signal transduction system YycFG